VASSTLANLLNRACPLLLEFAVVLPLRSWPALAAGGMGRARRHGIGLEVAGAACLLGAPARHQLASLWWTRLQSMVDHRQESSSCEALQ
jgi:hypothetical protein